MMDWRPATEPPADPCTTAIVMVEAARIASRRNGHG